MNERLYGDLASWWTLLRPPEDYREEAAQIVRWLGACRSVLELGSGVGHLAAGFPADLEVVLVDHAPAMLAESEKVNPGRQHVCADMTTLDLERTFDAVVLHDAVMYLTSPEQLRATFETAARHLRRGGRFVVLPDFVAEEFEEHLASGSRSDGARALSMTEWHWDPDPTDYTVQVDFALLLREDGAMQCIHEVHQMGLHPRQALWDALFAAGFTPLEVPLYDLRPEGEVFLVERT